MDHHLDKNMKKYIVVGGNGFIGYNMVNHLKRVEPVSKVVIIDNYNTSDRDEERINSDKFRNVWHYDVDISNREEFTGEILEELKDADCVFHFAARARVQPSIKDCLGYHDVNVNGTLNLLHFSVESKVKKFVYSSSSSVYGDAKDYPTLEVTDLNPISPYALQKLIGEQYCRLYSVVYGLDTVCLRYFNVYGEGMPLKGAYTLVMGSWINSYNNGDDLIIYGDGQQRRDFTYVGDVTEANYLSYINNVKNGEIFNIGSSFNKSINEIAEIFKEVLGCEFKNGPERLEPKITYANNEKARIMLNWKPKGNVINWLRNYLENNIKRKE